MNNIIFITGMAGSGKTTISLGVAEHFPKALHIGVDTLRQMMVTGRVLPNLEATTEEMARQFQMARTTAINMANLYASQGVDVVIDDVCFPPYWAEQYAALFEDPKVHRILLLPSRAALTQRIMNRGGPYAAVYVASLASVYDYLEPMPKDSWIVLDNSAWTVEQTVQEALSQIGAI